MCGCASQHVKSVPAPRTPAQFASLSVQVNMKAGTPVEGYRVILWKLDRQVFTNPHGRALLDSIPPGRWEVLSNYPSDDSLRRDTIQFTAGKQESLRIVLSRIPHGVIDTFTK